MNPAVQELVGRRISRVIVKAGKAVGDQLFLVFDDGTWFEIYSRFPMASSGHVHRGTARDVRAYMAEAQKIVHEFPAAEETSREGTADELGGRSPSGGRLFGLRVVLPN